MKIIQPYHQLVFSGIYCIENIQSKKKYIGSSLNIYHRLKRHLCDLRKNRHANPILQASFNKNGESSFIGYAVDFCSNDLLVEREEFFINKLNPYFNIKRLNLKRVVINDESKKLISNTLKEKYKNGMKSFDHPARKIPVNVYTLDCEFVGTFESASDCSRKLKVSKRDILRAISGIQERFGCKYQLRRINDLRPILPLSFKVMRNEYRHKREKETTTNISS